MGGSTGRTSLSVLLLLLFLASEHPSHGFSVSSPLVGQRGTTQLSGGESSVHFSRRVELLSLRRQNVVLFSSGGKLQQQVDDAPTSAAIESKQKEEEEEGPSDFFFATTTPSVDGATTSATTATTQATTAATANGDETQTRTLGSQELLMLPRQYSPSRSKFPQMNHVCAVVLSSTPSIATLQQALNNAIKVHPFLRCHVKGSGEPEKRIDLFQMVRKGEPDLETFVCPTYEEAREYARADKVLSVVDVPGGDRVDLDQSWEGSFRKNLDDGTWCDVYAGPLWRVELHRLADFVNGEEHKVDGEESSEKQCALVFKFNHAISDQSSVNVLIDELLADIAAMEEKEDRNPAVEQNIPITLEDSVLGINSRWADVGTSGLSLRTARYLTGKALEGLRNPVQLPDVSDEKKCQEDDGGVFGALTLITGKSPGGESDASSKRKSTVQLRNLSREATKALLDKCRAEGVQMTAALAAAVAFTSTDFIDGGIPKKDKKRNYKVLQSLDMRRFGQQLDKCETVACMAGSMDLMLGPLPDRLGKKLRTQSTSSSLSNDTDKLTNEFWNVARESKKQFEEFVESDGPVQATRVFDFAMTISDMNNLVHLTAQSKDSQGRAYSAGISNNGVYERQRAVRREKDGDGERGVIKVKHGKYEVQDIYFATSHARTGCLYQVSCITVNGEMKCTFHPAMPIVSEETNVEFADAFIELLEIVAGVKSPSPLSKSSQTNGLAGLLSAVPNNTLSLAATAFGVGGVGIHADAWSDFFQSVGQIRDAVTSSHDFWAPINFWIFFAVGHPLLQPILKLSDVLHGSPGPKIADLVPVTFLLGNLAVIAAFTFSKEIRNAVNILALSAFLTYVGAGLDGQAGLGDYNLQLDDNYQGQVVRGCPAYDEVRQPSMDGFDLERYQGKWYEQKFHDWTQFKEVYDTALDIQLTSDGKGWKDDFSVKGPAPDAAPLSWDKSPVANGAHYFLFGRVDEKDPPGVLRESGFGVEFPNYIVDVNKDPKTGEYTEAIQFQCLERGGVRVFEGINFLSRNPQMSQEELAAMHARAEKAGMYQYGASPEQMHTVARRGLNEPDVDNTWQAMWRYVGFDRLLELLTESIEDGGR